MDGDAPEPIEVELVANEPRPGRAARWRRDEPPPDAESSPDADERPGGARAERMRLVVVAAVAAVLSLALGWMIGRATSGPSEAVADDQASNRTTSTTVPAPFETLPIVGEEIDGADFEEPAEEAPTSTGRVESGPTTTAVSEPTVAPIAVDERLVGVPVRLVGVELGGVLVEADLAAGTLTDHRADERVTTDGTALVVGPDWVVSSSNGRSRVFRADGTAAPVDLGDSWQVYHVPGTDLFWRVPLTGPTEDGLVLSLVDLAGEPVGPELTLPLNAWPGLVDPANGGVIVSTTSRTYSVHPDGVDYLGLGSIIGITEQLLVTYDCDESFVCSLFVTDRATGERRPVPPDPDLDEEYQWGAPFGWGAGSSPTVSPDGRWATVIGSSWRSTVTGIVELDTGRFVELAQNSFPPTVSWSPDGRFAFALDDQVVVAYDVTTGDRFPVFTDTVQWVQLAARPLLIGSPGLGAEGATLLRVGPGTTRGTSGVAEESIEG